MDPRPYHFEYRRPRPFNPTYQSQHFFDSIYNPKIVQKENQQSSHQRYNKPYLKTPKSEPQTARRHQSMDIQKPQKILPSQPELEPKQKRSISNLSQIGNHLMKGPLEQTSIYEKQQKNFDIINYHTKKYAPKLKQFPRLTLEDHLLERNYSNQKRN